jgi:hypothetical protein
MQKKHDYKPENGPEKPGILSQSSDPVHKPLIAEPPVPRAWAPNKQSCSQLHFPLFWQVRWETPGQQASMHIHTVFSEEAVSQSLRVLGIIWALGNFTL